jgi:ABC-type transport system involved in cytochrome bd biosynthesis fused ATPase/permease subunit
MQLAGEGVEQLQTYYSGFMPQLYFSIAATLTMVVIIFFINVKTSLILLVFSPLIPLVIYIGLSIAKRILGKYWKSYFNLGNVFLDSIQGLTMLKIYDADEKRHQEMNVLAEDFRVKTMKLLRSQLNSINMMDIVAFGGLAAGIVTALFQMKKGNISVFGLEGNTQLLGIVLIILLCYDFFVPLRILGSLFHVAMNGIWASTFINDFLNLPEDQLSKKKLSNNISEISIENMNFSFDENPFIKDLNIVFAQNKITAIVGRSGCGKSTISNLLLGVLKGYEGSIKINGTENREIDPAERMKHINAVTHAPYFFKGSIRKNLLMAKHDATDEEMKALLKEVNLLDLLQEQDVLDIFLTENAGNLSGGQKQRLAIARALLHDPEIFIFDEATSNIDSESEEIIMKLIHKIAHKKTIIMISHRLSNVVKSDKIYYMQEGKIVEEGTHNELLAAQKKYAQIYHYQKELENYGKDELQLK